MAQRTAPPAERVTPIRCQPPVASQKALRAPCGSWTGWSLRRKIVPEVPSEMAPVPCSMMPAPTAAQALSPPPAATGVPSGRPVSAAASAVTRPVISLPSKISGRSACRDLQRGQDLVAVAPAGEVDEQGAGSIRGVGRGCARKPEPDQVLGQEDRGQPRMVVGLVRPEPQDLGRLEPGAGKVAGDGDQPLPPQPALDLQALGVGAAVVP